MTVEDPEPANAPASELPVATALPKPAAPVPPLPRARPIVLDPRVLLVGGGVAFIGVMVLGVFLWMVPTAAARELQAACRGMKIESELNPALCPTGAACALPIAAPDFTAQDITGKQVKLSDLRGKVVLLEFWTFACWNCQHVEPEMKRWHAAYADRGLTVIGVHTPELDYEKDPANVERYVREHGITYPVAIDNDSATWDRYDNHAWPALYLIDRKGQIRYVRVGEGAYDETQRRIEALLAE